MGRSERESQRKLTRAGVWVGSSLQVNSNASTNYSSRSWGSSLCHTKCRHNLVSRLAKRPAAAHPLKLEYGCKKQVFGLAPRCSVSRVCGTATVVFEHISNLRYAAEKGNPKEARTVKPIWCHGCIGIGGE